MSQKEFDFIVVGGGSAGCLPANRLSADPRNRVVLLEAGRGDKNPLIKMPIGFTRLMYDEKVTNIYKTEPELNGREVSAPRGRVLGGCSSINGMIYTRGQRGDYDEWAELPGCDGWSYDELLPYFRRPEHFEVESGNPYHGDSGELNVKHVEMRGDPRLLAKGRHEHLSPRGQRKDGPVGRSRARSSTTSCASMASKAFASWIARSSPSFLSGNTHAPVVAVADRAADLILGKPVLQPGA